MATLTNKRKLAAVTREIDEEHPRNGQSRNTSVPRINKEYITKVSEDIEGRVTKKLSQEFSRTASRIFCALSKLDEFLLNPQIRTHSGTVPGTFRYTNVGNQGANEDDSQSDPHTEAGIFRSQTTQKSGPEDGHYINFPKFLINKLNWVAVYITTFLFDSLLIWKSFAFPFRWLILMLSFCICSQVGKNWVCVLFFLKEQFFGCRWKKNRDKVDCFCSRFASSSWLIVVVVLIVCGTNCCLPWRILKRSFYLWMENEVKVCKLASLLDVVCSYLVTHEQIGIGGLWIQS